jgi:hypothetical protein
MKKSATGTGTTRGREGMGEAWGPLPDLVLQSLKTRPRPRSLEIVT